MEDENFLTAAGVEGCLVVGGWLTAGQDMVQVEENKKSHKKVLFIQWTKIHQNRRVFR